MIDHEIKWLPGTPREIHSMVVVTSPMGLQAPGGTPSYARISTSTYL